MCNSRDKLLEKRYNYLRKLLPNKIKTLYNENGGESGSDDVSE